MQKKLAWLLLTLALAAGAAGCSSGPRAVRGSDEPGLDYHAMGTGLDKRDLQRMMNENMKELRRSQIVLRWIEEFRQQGPEKRPAVAVLDIRNETSEHIDSALDALISDIETELISWGGVKVISLDRQSDLMREIRQQKSEYFDQAQTSQLGKQVGARYFLTGKVFTTDERVGEQRRVQYYLFMQVIDVETGEIMYQHKTNTTKALIDD